MFDGDSDGLIHGIKENAIWIDHSTTDHEQNKVHVCSRNFDQQRGEYCLCSVADDATRNADFRILVPLPFPPM